MNKNILLTVFRGTSAELLLKSVFEYQVLVLPNDTRRDSKILKQALEKKDYDYVISLGQRPNIWDKVHIETCARAEGHTIISGFDCVGLLHKFQEHGMQGKLSNNAGTSFCNQLYWNGLSYISENGIDTKMVFVHVPFEKNISCVTDFQKKLLKVLLDNTD